VVTVEAHHARGHRAGLDGFVDGDEGDAFAGGVNDHPAAGEGCDDLIVLVLGGERGGGANEGKEKDCGNKREAGETPITRPPVDCSAHRLHFTPAAAALTENCTKVRPAGTRHSNAPLLPVN
jgi:hypothetical protein